MPLISRSELAQAAAAAADAAEVILGVFCVFGGLVFLAVGTAALIVRAFDAFEGPSK